MSKSVRGVLYAQVILMLFAAVTMFVTDASAQRAGRRISGAAITKRAPAKTAVRKTVKKPSVKDDAIVPERLTVEPGAVVPMTAMIKAQADKDSLGEQKSVRQMMFEKGLIRELEGPERADLPGNPLAKPFNRFPYPSKAELMAEARAARATSFSTAAVEPQAPQTVTLQFDGATGPTETGAFPPDTMGAVGPTQFMVFLNGRIRTFNKTTGAADGVMNVDSDVFFASVVTPPAAGEVSFTSDPQVRYDRLTGRWFLVIIDVTLNSTSGATTKANRVLIAVSDAASSNAITAGTVWTLYQFQGDPTLFTDYESLGIDANALYIGGDMFTLAGSFNSTKGFVIPKAPALTGSPLTVWSFSGLVATAAGAGPFAPRGVDNPDPTNTGLTATGYFIGPDNATFNTLMIRRVTNPGSLGPAPTISANISVATPLTTRFPVTVPHLGNTIGTNGNLDSLDDRLYAATIRNGRLWTAHNIGVNNTGVAGASNNRNAVRWYELQNLGTTPAVVQSGTLFDNNATNDINQRSYWIPSIMVSGQGHVALGASIAGTNERINAFTTGRLSGDTLGTLRDGPGGSALAGYTNTASAYNPAGDPGPTRRWGDYSFTSLDPKDDMTMWTIQQYCNGTNTYGVRVAKLSAPPPATPASSNFPTVPANVAAFNVVITGTSVAGSGFYDPGANPAAPHTAFNHISASVTGGVTVRAIAYTDPTHVTLTLDTRGASQGAKNVTITNPDGQTATGNGIITVNGTTAAPADIAGRVTNAAGAGLRGVTLRITDNSGFTRTVMTNSFGYYVFSSVPTGVAYMLTPSLKGYSFSPSSALYNHTDTISNLDFSAASGMTAPLKTR